MAPPSCIAVMKGEEPRKIKEQHMLTPPVLSEWRWDVLEKCIAFEGCCYLGYHFLSLCSILEFSLAWKWEDLAMEEWRNKKKEVKWKAWGCNAGLQLWGQPSNTQYAELLLVNHKTLHKLYCFCQCVSSGQLENTWNWSMSLIHETDIWCDFKFSFLFGVLQVNFA